jgi:hypothetical protein
VRHPAVDTVRYPAATRLSSEGSPLKVLSRIASPAGFALVLLLFFLLPFVSVSCDVPGQGEMGVNYTGSHLVSGADPQLSTDLLQVADELRDAGTEADAPEDLVNPPDADVRVLAMVLAVLAAAGVSTALIPRLRARLVGGTVAAAATLVVTVVTALVSQSHLRSALLDTMRQSGLAEQQDDAQRLEAVVDGMTHTEVGFWLMVVLLALITIVTGTLGLFGDRLRAARAHRTSEDGVLSGLPFGADDTDGRGQPPPDA